MKVPYLSEAQVEAHAEEVLAAYVGLTSSSLTLPIPIEKIAHRVLDLPVVWESLPSIPGREVVSKIVQPTLGSPAHIILNLDMIDTTFRDCPGLEHTAIAHEAGHGRFHLDRGRVHQLDLGLDMHDGFSSNRETFASRLEAVLGQRGPEGDDWWREWQAHTFMRFVLMPRRLLMPLLEERGYLRWTGPGGLYELRDRLGVTISALVVHLTKLGFIRVDQRKVIHDVAPLASGQRAFGA